MPRVNCATIECEFNDEGKCKAKSIILSDHSIMTVWEGRQQYQRCKTFQKSQEMIDLEQRFGQWLKGKVEECTSKAGR